MATNFRRCPPRFVEAAVVHVCVEGHPVLPILGHLEHPVPEGGAAVPPGVTKRVGRGDHPQAQVDGEPRVLVVIRVAIQGGAIPAQDVLQSAVREVPPLR